MFHMIVHVPVEKAVDRVHPDRPAVEPMIEHVFGETRMLRIAVDDVEPTAVKAGSPMNISGRILPV